MDYINVPTLYNKTFRIAIYFCFSALQTEGECGIIEKSWNGWCSAPAGDGEIVPEGCPGVLFREGLPHANNERRNDHV